MYYSLVFYLFFFFLVIAKRFFCTTWSVEKSRVVSFFLFFLALAGQAEGNIFFLNFVLFEENVMFVMLA